jgi:hypothetical protein
LSRRPPSNGPVHGSQSSIASGIADFLVLVFGIVAGRHDLPQIAAGDLLPGCAGRSQEGLADPGDRCRLRPA